jgi:hypothetical protein
MQLLLHFPSPAVLFWISMFPFNRASFSASVQVTVPAFASFAA